MNKLKDYITYTVNNGIKTWSINTTLSKLIGQNKSPELKEEISNWQLYEWFYNKYGQILDRPIRLINIYFLISFNSIGKIIGFPQAPPDKLSNLNYFKIQYDNNWIYERELQYDPDFHFSIKNKGFSNLSIYTEMFLVDKFEQINHLVHSGFGDWSSLENYYIIKQENIDSLLAILKSETKPSLDDILDLTEFFCMDFKGEDQGYGSLFEIYTSKNNTNLIETIIFGFEEFKNSFDNILIYSLSLNEVENKILELMKKYGC